MDNLYTHQFHWYCSVAHMAFTNRASGCSSFGAFGMRLLSKRQVREKVLYSPQHIQRLETAGKFPKRVRLGQGRVGWVESEIEEWLAAKLLERDKAEDGSR